MMFWTLLGLDGIILCAALGWVAFDLFKRAKRTRTDEDTGTALALGSIVFILGLSVAAALFDAIHPGVQFPFTIREAIFFPSLAVGNTALFYFLRSRYRRTA